MDAKTLEFMAFTLFSCLCLLSGYIVRRKNWAHEDLSKRIHFHTIVWVWALAGFLSMWRFPLRPQDLWLLVIVPLWVAIPGFGAIPICKKLKFSRSHTGVIACAAGMGNMGFTLGAYLCYLMLTDQAAALAYGIAVVSIMQVTSIVLLYPVARHFGKQDEVDLPLSRLILSSFDLRAMPLYAAATGLALAAFKVPAPVFLWNYHLIDALFYLGAFGALFGIGMKLKFQNTRQYYQQQSLLVGFKFIFLPAITLVMIYAINSTPLQTNTLFNEVLFIESTMPTALMTVMMANLFHLDTRLACSLWFWNTAIFLCIPLPVILWWFG
ncbi:Membrane transport protein [Poriferisphaera corsica]|uniref:Membrane transport protein n=1 Tax=Poriferisphaera corsica TaxID=2528020 RepID=A0A517YW08_9BACT|nr:hypothetical protein [Poriferisphaera corsica]QDU34403.1 Membrane transport protein [Poriferisphaera corsica]